MGHLVSRQRPSDAASVEAPAPGQGGLDEDRSDGQARQGVQCCLQGPCPLHPPIPQQTRPLLVSALRGSVPCLHTRHLLPRSIYPGGYLGRIEPDAVPWQCVPSKLHQYWLPPQSLNYCANHKTLSFSSKSEAFHILN